MNKKQLQKYNNYLKYLINIEYKIDFSDLHSLIIFLNMRITFELKIPNNLNIDIILYKNKNKNIFPLSNKNDFIYSTFTTINIIKAKDNYLTFHYYLDIFDSFRYNLGHYILA